MGEAVLRALTSGGVVPAADISVAEVNAERCAFITKTYGVRGTADPTVAADGADIVLFAIKPQEFESVGHSIKSRITAGQTIMSIMAGVPIARIQRTLGASAIVRVMPNTPAAIGESISVWTATPDVNEAARAHVAAMLDALGNVIEVTDEKYLDMATALNGSGPGYVFMLIEAFIDAGVHIGLPRATAETLAIQTFLGAAKYAQVTGRHPAVLRNEVTSPAGTTAAGLQVLEDAGIRGIIVEAVVAAYERSKELGA